MSTKLIEGHAYVGGHKIAYLEQGSGSLVILIHGIPTNSQMWRAIIPQLAATHRVIAPDLLNYGQSEKPKSADVSINAQSRMILHFMRALGIRSADVVAHDIGGGVAQLIAVNAPEAVRKLVLIECLFRLVAHPGVRAFAAPGGGGEDELESLHHHDARLYAHGRCQQKCDDRRGH